MSYKEKLNDECGWVVCSGPRPGAGEAASVWVITRHDAKTLEVEMFKVTPGFTGKMSVSEALLLLKKRRRVPLAAFCLPYFAKTI